MRNILKHLWQLPQHLIAWWIILFCKTERRDDHNGRKVYRYLIKRCCCLGNYIFVAPNNDRETTIAHEYGHSRQSLYLGWLYLLIIGLPSAMNPWTGAKYYSMFCERWANELGGLEVRKAKGIPGGYILAFKK